MDVRSLVKLEAFATAFRTIVTVAAGMVALAILAGVTASFALASAVLLLLVAIAGPLMSGWLAVVLRDEREWALEATLIGTAVLWTLDGAATLTVHIQDLLADWTWAYVLGFVLVSIVHVVVLVQAGRLLVQRRDGEPVEPELDAESA